MRIVAIFNIWADCLDLLCYAIGNIRPVVDDIIVVYSWKSNRGNVVKYDLPKDCILVQCEPTHSMPHPNELMKRNAGLSKAQELGFTHFIMMDSDEFYLQSEFTEMKTRIQKEGITGSVCQVKAYFKSPTLTVGMDTNIVPFIHKITPGLRYMLNDKNYPFAIENGQPRIDCTRRLNIKQGVKMLPITMHHYSYVRKDIDLKLKNSSANFKDHRAGLVYEDLKNAKPGYKCYGTNRELIECENLFNLPIYE